MIRVYVASMLAAVCLLAASAVQFGRDGLSAGLVCVAVVSLLLASRWAKVVG